MQFKGLELDKFQEEAIAAIEENKSVVVCAPTGSGKTLIADYIIKRDIEKGIRVIYTAPIKALSNQKYKDFCKDYGAEKVGIITGDVVKNPEAFVLVMTTEIYRNMLLTKDELLQTISYVIFDEIHYINDLERGYVWEESIIFGNPTTRLLCLSATIPNAEELAGWIAEIKDHEVIVVRHDQRPVPLQVMFFDQAGIKSMKEFNSMLNAPEYRFVLGTRNRKRPPKPSHVELIKEIEDKLPALFFCFSRSECERMASELSKKEFFRPDSKISSIVSEKLSGYPDISSISSVRLLRQVLPYGIGFHHAGLIPVMKELVEELFSIGKIKVLYTTETFALGVNMPAKSVCIESFRKFDGRSFRLMNSKEFFQIAGRAGRRGIDTRGFVFIFLDGTESHDKIKEKISKDREPITSQFKLSVNTVLNLVGRHSVAEIEEILHKSFDSFQRFGSKYNEIRNYRSHNTFDNLKVLLEKLGYIEDGKLTERGVFLSKIYSDELVIGEIFSKEMHKEIDEYQTLLVIGAICYEHSERDEFFKKFPSKTISQLEKKLRHLEEKRFHDIENLSSIYYPLFRGDSIIDLFKHTNIPEGDIIRLLRQVIDKLSQLKAATNDESLKKKCVSLQSKVIECLSKVDPL